MIPPKHKEKILLVFVFYRINDFSVCFWNFIGKLGGFHVTEENTFSALQQFVYLFLDYYKIVL